MTTFKLSFALRSRRRAPRRSGRRTDLRAGAPTRHHPETMPRLRWY